MRISTRGRYAIETVLDLAIYSGGGHVRLADIAGRRGLSENYLEQIFIDLRKNGIVKSIRGPKGGYLLAKDPSRITCGEIIRASEKRTSPVMCVAEGLDRLECGRYDRCAARILWEKIRLAAENAADSVTIRDLEEKCGNTGALSEIEYHI